MPKILPSVNSSPICELGSPGFVLQKVRFYGLLRDFAFLKKQFVHCLSITLSRKAYCKLKLLAKASLAIACALENAWA